MKQKATQEEVIKADEVSDTDLFKVVLEQKKKEISMKEKEKLRPPKPGCIWVAIMQ